MTLYALSPLDGRYAKTVDPLRPYLSEGALIAARIEVEVRYLQALLELGLPELRDVAVSADVLAEIYTHISPDKLAGVKEHEKRINHDVKAVEYFLVDEFSRRNIPFPRQFIHFGLTSEDVTNVAYGVLLHRLLRQVIEPEWYAIVKSLEDFALQHKDRPMLALTHGQPATPTTVSEQIQVFANRVRELHNNVSVFTMQGKFGGAVGNLSAHHAAYPEVNWRTFAIQFLLSLELRPLVTTTQINPHDDVARLSHLMCECNSVLIDLCQDMWLYISRNVFLEKPKAEEVGSSTMPNKVNPIDWENAEGNAAISTGIFETLARKLPISRLQRDLSDSTMQRCLGTAFGHHYLVLKSVQRGLGKLQVNPSALEAELRAHPEVHAEAIQTVMRRYGYADAYERLKALTRGQSITATQLIAFVEKLEHVPAEAKGRLIDRINATR